MLAEVRQLRPDLVLVAMSATLDVPALAEVLGDEGGPAPVVDQAAAQHPLEVVWAPPTGRRLDQRGVDREGTGVRPVLKMYAFAVD